MSTATNTPSAGDEFLRKAREITLSHLEMVGDESIALFTQMLGEHWRSEGILEDSESSTIPIELARIIKSRYSLEQIQQLCSFFLNFFSGGLSGISDGSLSFTQLEFEGLQLFEKKFAARLPQADSVKLRELIDLLKKA